MEIFWAILFVLVVLIAWLSNVLGLPGNWLMLVCAIIYWSLIPAGHKGSISTTLLIILAVLAVIGELLELASGSFSVSKAGGNRRSALYAIMGSIGGAFVGMLIGVPIPVIGPIVGSLVFGSVGAMAGAVYSERSSGRNWKSSLQVGKSAFWGRALGTVVKLAVGLIMLVLTVVGLIV